MINIILCVISYDIWFYISHILLHKNAYLKNIHKIHHEVNYENMIYSDAYVGHYFESPFQSIGAVIPILFITIHFYEFILVVFFLNVRGLIRHDHRLIWLYGNHHILHHKYSNCNYGEYWIDYIFNTLEEK